MSEPLGMTVDVQHEKCWRVCRGGVLAVVFPSREHWT